MLSASTEDIEDFWFILADSKNNEIMSIDNLEFDEPTIIRSG